MLKIGDAAPRGTLPSARHRAVALAAHWPAVWAVYPSDDTPSCTNEMRDFARLAPALRKCGVTLFGLNRDSLESHRRFRDRYALGFDLLSDTDGAVTDALGVWQMKTTFGKSYMGLVRSSFLIDGEGIIRAVWTVSRVRGHAESVLQAARDRFAGG